MSRKVIGYGGLGAVGVATYYLYSAGGSPKVAEKQFEHDAARASAKLKGELPGREKEAKTAAEQYKEQLSAKADSAVADAKATASKVDEKLAAYRQDAGKKFDEYRKETGAELNKAVDQFDKKVSEGASQSKSWLGSWFGGK